MNSQLKQLQNAENKFNNNSQNYVTENPLTKALNNFPLKIQDLLIESI